MLRWRRCADSSTSRLRLLACMCKRTRQDLCFGGLSKVYGFINFRAERFNCFPGLRRFPVALCVATRERGLQAAYKVCPVSRIVRSMVGSEHLSANADSCSISTSHGNPRLDEISRCTDCRRPRRSTVSSSTTRHTTERTRRTRQPDTARNCHTIAAPLNTLPAHQSLSHSSISFCLAPCIICRRFE